jgi:predicted AAA+ superfamily ATPase
VGAQLGEALWPGTGRLVRLPMHGLTTRERLGRTNGPGFFERVLDGSIASPIPSERPPNLRDYVGEMLTGGFPLPALSLDDAGRSLWMTSYLEQVVTRDTPQLAPGRDAAKLTRFVETLAIHSACVVDDATLYRAAGINRRTGQAYEALLMNLGLVEVLPAWWTNRIKRLVQRPKRVFNDPALVAAALGMDADGVLRDGDVLGRLLETYVVAQLRAESSATRRRVRLHHLRTERGRHEVDLVAEFPRQGIIGIEVKATSAPGAQDARHLRWLRDSMEDRFLAGIVLHTGPRVFSLGEQLTAVPIASLWG